MLRIKSGEQFNWLMDHVVAETHRTWDHWNLWGGLDTALGEYGVEMNQAAQFWRLTIRAHQDSVILRLGRLFDPNGKALSFCNLLQTIRHIAITPALAHLGFDLQGLDLGMLQADLETVVENDPLVCRLLDVRNEYLAHRSSRLVISGTFSALPRLEREDIEALLKRASSVADKYSQLCGRPFVMSGYAGADDYKSMLHLLRLGLEYIKAKHAQDKQRITGN